MVARVLLLLLVSGCYVAVRAGPESASRGTLTELTVGVEIPLAQMHPPASKLRAGGPWVGLIGEAPVITRQPDRGREHFGVGSRAGGIGAIAVTPRLFVRGELAICGAGAKTWSGGYGTAGLEAQVFWGNDWAIAGGIALAEGINLHDAGNERWNAPLGTVKFFYTASMLSWGFDGPREFR